MPPIKKVPAMVLQELAVKMKKGPAEFRIVSQVMGGHENNFDYEVAVLGVVGRGSGPSKQVAKHNAAYDALMQLKELCIYDPNANPVEMFNSSMVPEGEDDTFATALNFISHLKDLCFENKLCDPIFNEISAVGPPHAREFTYECAVGSIKSVATGNTKKKARHLAAKAVLEKIQGFVPETPDLTTIDPSIKAIMESESNLDEVDQECMERAHEYVIANVVVNKSVQVPDYWYTLQRQAEEKGVVVDDLLKGLEGTEDETTLTKVLEMMELQYKFQSFNEEDEVPFIASLSISTDTPFSLISIGQCKKNVKNDLLRKAFGAIKLFLNLKNN